MKFGASTAWLKEYFATRGDPWNGPRVLPKQRERIRKALDPDYAIAVRLRLQFHKQHRKGKINCILRSALKRGGESEFAIKELGYTVAQLRVHIERQFTAGMSWATFAQGLIHIDHILPVSSFALADGDDVRRCWALSNLRPMWAGENQRKHAKRMYLI